MDHGTYFLSTRVLLGSRSDRYFDGASRCGKNTVDVNVVSPDSNGGGVDASNVESFLCHNTQPIGFCVDEITADAPVGISWINSYLFANSTQLCRLIVSVNGISGGTSTVFQMLRAGNNGNVSENNFIVYSKPLSVQAGDIIQFEVRELKNPGIGQLECRGAVSFLLEPQQSQ